MNINLFNNIISAAGILFVCFYILKKAINYKIYNIIQKMIFILWCFLWAYIYTVNISRIPLFIIRILFCATSIVVILIFLKINIDTAVSAFLLSYGISNSLYYIAVIPIGLIFAPFLGDKYNNYTPVDFNNLIYPLSYILVFALQFVMAQLLFKIKRFRNGFPFLFKKYAVILALIVAGIVMIITSTFSSFLFSPRERYDSIYVLSMFIVGTIILGFGIIIWIKRGIKIFYKKKMKELAIEQLEQELFEAKAEIQHLIKHNELLRIANHKTIHRLSALERGTVGMIELIKSGRYSTEINEEFAVSLENIKRLKQDYENDISQIQKENPLPSTKIKGLDDMFKYFSEEYNDNKIDFHLKVNGSIPYLVENIIGQNKLETMIGDHLQDALIAVNASDNTFRSVLAIIGLSERGYEFTVFDSGIPFEAETLMRLGTEYVTTYAYTGGSGIGFMTTFETMRECGASLIINEKEPSKCDYTKSVTVRFDKENRYIIETYRSEDIMKNDEKYMVVSNL